MIASIFGLTNLFARAIGGGLSDFALASQYAVDLLEMGRSQGATKELIFITDGQDGGNGDSAEADLQDLRDVGINIGGEITPVKIGGVKILERFMRLPKVIWSAT